MHEGKMVDSGKPDDVILHPTSPVTVRLLDDIPEIHKEWIKR
jgi:peptide/nickel transport system ATP-binding protein